MLPYGALGLAANGTRVVTLCTSLSTGWLASTPHVGSMAPPAEQWHSQVLQQWTWIRKQTERWKPTLGMTLSSPRLQAKRLSRRFRYAKTHRETEYAPDLGFQTLILCPRIFDFPKQRLPSRFHFVQPCLDLDRHPANETIPSSKSAPHGASDNAEFPVVICSMGSIYGSEVVETPEAQTVLRFLKNAIVAFSRHPQYRFLVRIGRLNRSDLGTIPGNVTLVPELDQIAALRTAALMVTHGGLNSVKECIYFQVPMLVCPVRDDQPGNAARVAYHGLGENLPIDAATPERISEKLSSLIHSSLCRDRLKSMSQRFKQEELSASAVTTLERIVHKTQNEISPPLYQTLHN